MAEFLVETYVARGDTTGPQKRARQARVAAEELRREGEPVRYVRSIFLPEDETCFYLFEASSVDAVREAARRASLRVDRITEAEPDTRGG